MVPMRRLTIEVEDDIYVWIELRRGSASPEEFAARAIASYRATDEHGTRGWHTCTTTWRSGWKSSGNGYSNSTGTCGSGILPRLACHADHAAARYVYRQAGETIR
jgi:hypothetical protein